MLYFGKFSMFLKGIHVMKPKGRRPFSRRMTDMAVTVWRTLDSNDRQGEGQSCNVLLSRGQLSGNQRPPVTGFSSLHVEILFLKWTSARKGSFQLPRFSFAYLFKFHVPSCFSLNCQPFQTNTQTNKKNFRVQLTHTCDSLDALRVKWMFLMSWPFLGGIPTIDSSTKH